MSAVTAGVDGLLLRRWQRSKITEQLASMEPVCEMLSMKKGVGKPSYAVETNLSTGRSNTATVAEANATEGHEAEFQAAYHADYAAMIMEYANVLATKDDAAAIVSTVKRQYEIASRSLKRSLCFGIYRDGLQSRGVIASTSTPDIVLTRESDARFLAAYKGAKVVFAAAAANGALRNSGATATIVEVDIDTKTVTFSAALPGAVVAGDHVILEGDAANTGAAKHFEGFQALFPNTVSGTFRGVAWTNFSRNIVAGVYTDQSANTGSILDKVRQGSVQIYEGGELISLRKSGFCRLSVFNDISTALSSLEHHYTSVEKGVTDMGHAALRLTLGGAQLDLYSSFFAPENEIVVLDTDPSAIEIVHLDDKPFSPLQIEDSTVFQRTGSQFKGLLGSHVAVLPYTPSAHGRIQLA